MGDKRDSTIHRLEHVVISSVYPELDGKTGIVEQINPSAGIACIVRVKPGFRLALSMDEIVFYTHLRTTQEVKKEKENESGDERRQCPLCKAQRNEESAS